MALYFSTVSLTPGVFTGLPSLWWKLMSWCLSVVDARDIGHQRGSAVHSFLQCFLCKIFSSTNFLWVITCTCLLVSKMSSENQDLENTRSQTGSLERLEKDAGFPKRYVLALMVFLGFSVLYALRVNLNVAIGAMCNNHTIYENGFYVNKVSILASYVRNNHSNNYTIQKMASMSMRWI